MPNNIALKLEEEIKNTDHKGSIEAVMSLLAPLSSKQIQKALLADDSRAFRTAVMLNQYRIVKYLLNIVDVKTRKQMLSAKRDRLMIVAIASACLNLESDSSFQFHLPILDNEHRTINDIVRYMEPEGFSSKYLNCPILDMHGKPRMISILLAAAKDDPQAEVKDYIQERLLMAHNYLAIRMAVSSGLDDSVRYALVGALLKDVSDKMKNCINAYFDYSSFEKAAKSGNIKMVKYFLNEAPANSIENLLAYNAFEPLIGAAGNGHVEIVIELLARADKNLKERMLFAKSLLIADRTAFCCAVGNEHLEVVNVILDSLDENTKQTLLRKNRYALVLAVENGDRPMVKTLLCTANNKTLSFLLSKEGLNPFEQAKLYGHDDILDDLEKAAAQVDGRLDKQQQNNRFFNSNNCAFFGNRLIPCPLAVPIDDNGMPLAQQVKEDEEKESLSEADKGLVPSYAMP